jgi:hypothetical protein
MGVALTEMTSWTIGTLKEIRNNAAYMTKRVQTSPFEQIPDLDVDENMESYLYQNI